MLSLCPSRSMWRIGYVVMCTIVSVVCYVVLIKSFWFLFSRVTLSRSFKLGVCFVNFNIYLLTIRCVVNLDRVNVIFAWGHIIFSQQSVWVYFLFPFNPSICNFLIVLKLLPTNRRMYSQFKLSCFNTFSPLKFVLKIVVSHYITKSC